MASLKQLKPAAMLQNIPNQHIAVFLQQGILYMYIYTIFLKTSDPLTRHYCPSGHLQEYRPALIYLKVFNMEESKTVILKLSALSHFVVFLVK